MPTNKTWLLRVAEIRSDVAALDVPVVDRVLFERLFHIADSDDVDQSFRSHAGRIESKPMLAERPGIEFLLSRHQIPFDAFQNCRAANLIPRTGRQQRVSDGFRLLQIRESRTLPEHKVSGWSAPLM